MAQIKNKLDIKNSIADEVIKISKSLPNFFNNSDEISTPAGIGLSLLFHGALALIFWLMVLLGITFPRFNLPELPNQDIEFKLVQQESKPPINKNTKIRSDRDSQAGGKHNPKRPVSDPTPKAAQKSKPAPAAQAQKPVQKAQPKAVQPAKPQPQKAVQKPIQQQKPVLKPQQQTKQAPAKPSAIKAPSIAPKPAMQPTAQGVAKPSSPKIAAAPKSPFAIPTQSGSPAGSTYKPAGVPTPGGGSSRSSNGTAAPAPKFSSAGKSGGSGSGAASRPASGGSYASRGSSGGSGGNPSPGNPNGKPGIDAIKQPNWGPYMRDLEQRIKRNWTPPKGDSSKRVVIAFEISRDGRLLSKRIVKSSGVPLADTAAMSAIEQTAPFRPLPPEFKGSKVPIEFTFDYNVLNSVMR